MIIMEQLYREMYPSLLAYAESQLKNPAQAEEAVQHTFLIAWTRNDRLRLSENPRGWLMITLKNVLRNMARKKAKLTELLTDSQEFDVHIYLDASDETSLDLDYADLISREDYQLLKLVALQNYSMPEAAEELGISLEACKKRVQRAKRKLRAALDEVEKIQ